MLDIHSGYHHIFMPPDLRLEIAFNLSMWKIPMEKDSLLHANSTKYFMNLMFKLFFKYLDECLVFWMEDLLIYSQTNEKHLKHLELVFKKCREAGMKLKMQIFKKEIEYVGHLVPGQGYTSHKTET